MVAHRLNSHTIVVLETQNKVEKLDIRPIDVINGKISLDWARDNSS